MSHDDMSIEEALARVYAKRDQVGSGEGRGMSDNKNPPMSIENALIYVEGNRWRRIIAPSDRAMFALADEVMRLRAELAALQTVGKTGPQNATVGRGEAAVMGGSTAAVHGPQTPSKSRVRRPRVPQNQNSHNGA